MGRRRPVLRQVPTKPVDIIDLASDSESAEEETNSNVLPAAPVPTTAPSKHVHGKASAKAGGKKELEADCASDLDSEVKNAFSVVIAADERPPPGGAPAATTAQTKQANGKPSIKADVGDVSDSVATGLPHAPGVFHLYQDGLTPDQVLQLCYMRRRAPRSVRRERMRIEDEFVLPRPTLKISDVLPPVDIPLQQLVASATMSSSVESASSTAATPNRTDRTVEQARESAQKHFLSPREADVGDVRLWAFLSDYDWTDVYQRVQSSAQQCEPLPSLADMCWLLQECHSDALVHFVWEQLLIPLLRREVRVQADGVSGFARGPTAIEADPSQTPGARAHTLYTAQHLLELLISHQSFASLAPKDFRAKVRERNLRQVDETFGAQMELALVALFRRQRDAKQP